MRDVETQITEYGLSALIWAKEKSAGALRVAARQQWDLASRYDQDAVATIKTAMRRLAVQLYAAAAFGRRDLAYLREKLAREMGSQRARDAVRRYGIGRASDYAFDLSELP